MRGVMRGNKSPGADGLHRALIEAHADSLNDLDLRGAAVGADQNVRSGGIKDRRRDGKVGILIVRESGFYELNRRTGRKNALGWWDKVTAAAASSSAAWMRAAEAIQQIRWDWKKTRDFASGGKQIVVRNRRVSGKNDHSCDDDGMCQQ